MEPSPKKRENFEDELLIENKLKDLYNNCKPAYLKKRINKSMKLLEKFRTNTSASTDIHNTFQFMSENEKTLDNTALQNKWSNLKSIKMKDFDLKNSINMDTLESMVETRLQNIEAEERHVSRLIEKSEFLNKQNLHERTLTN